MLDKKLIWAIFVFEFKMGHKAVETINNINNTFGPGTANQCTVQWWFKKFCKGNESLQDEKHSGWSWEVNYDQLRAIIEAVLLITTWEVAKKLNVDHSKGIRHLKQTGKVKKLNKWMPHELTANQKSHRFEVSSSLILRNHPSLDWIVTCDERWTLYNNWQWPAQWLDREDAPKHFPKPNLHQKRTKVTVWWPPACLIHYSFWNPSEIMTSEKSAEQIDEMHWKLPHLQLVLVNRRDPILHDNPRPHSTQQMFQNLNQSGHEVFPRLPYSPDLLPTDSHLFKHLDNFLQGKHLHNHQEGENAFQEFTEFWSMDFYATGMKEVISCWEKCINCSSSYFD